MSARVALGPTGLLVSPVCFGTWQLSPRFWLDQPKADIVAAMHRAVDRGINFFDTADNYGDGYAETVLGEFLATQRREDLVVCTKVFNHFSPDGTRYPDLRPEPMAQRCELQLRRLGIETIDLYLLHLWDPLTPLADVAAGMQRLVEQGKVRACGVSNFTVEQTRAVRQLGPFDVMQPSYSLANTAIEKDLLPYCQSTGMGVMVYSPMHKGLLSGKYAGTESFTDFRRHHPDFQGERFRQLAEAVRGLQPLADRYAMSLYQLVLTATLMHPSIQVAVVGIKNAAQIEAAAGAMGKQLTREDCFAVRSALAPETVKMRDAQGVVK
jgi:aryl-alcohol dehydrogenase-like predicted oxidoreductase